jgi:hypothetical protein
MQDNMQDNKQGNLQDKASQEIMALVLDHYVKYHNVVLKKLQIAQEATAKSIGELKTLPEGQGAAREQVGNLDDAEIYDEMWGDIIRIFKSHGISEEDMKKIEAILLIIPRQIKAHYDAIMAEDRALQVLIRKLNSDEYKKAYEIVREVQIRQNPMSGLGPEEYDDVPEEDVFTYRIASKNN